MDQAKQSDQPGFFISALLFLPLRLFGKIRKANPWLTGFPGPDLLVIRCWHDAGIGTSLDHEPGVLEFIRLFKTDRALFIEELENKAWRSFFRFLEAFSSSISRLRGNLPT